MISVLKLKNQRYTLNEIESSGLSFVPCGKVNGKDQPLLPYKDHWSYRKQVTRKSYGEEWNEYRLSQMNGIQIFTGYSTFRAIEDDFGCLYYTSIDIEAFLIENFPEHTYSIKKAYMDNITGTPCVLKTKSNGLRLDAFTTYVDKKLIFQTENDMLCEILSDKCLTRLDSRYELIIGSITEMPNADEALIHTVADIMSDITKTPKAEKTENHVPTKRQIKDSLTINNLNIHWDAYNRSQLFETQYCKATQHKSNRKEVRFTRYSHGGIDGKCFNCNGHWWEVPPTTPQKANVKKYIHKQINRRIHS